MKLQHPNLTIKSPSKRKTNNKDRGLAFTIVSFLILIGIIAGVMHWTQSLKTQADLLGEETAKLKKDIEKFDYAINGLKADIETSRGEPHIVAKIAEFNLNLRPSDPLQVRSISVRRTNRPSIEDRNKQFIIVNSIF